MSIYNNVGDVSLKDWIDDKDFSKSEYKKILLQLLIQLVVLQEERISHGDVAKQNVILKKNYKGSMRFKTKQYKVKIDNPKYLAFFIDYGLCVPLNDKMAIYETTLVPKTHPQYRRYIINQQGVDPEHNNWVDIKKFADFFDILNDINYYDEDLINIKQKLFFNIDTLRECIGHNFFSNVSVYKKY
jgi:hypothetical protein